MFGARETELTFQSKKSGPQTRPIVQMPAQKELSNDTWVSSAYCTSPEKAATEFPQKVVQVMRA